MAPSRRGRIAAGHPNPPSSAGNHGLSQPRHHVHGTAQHLSQSEEAIETIPLSVALRTRTLPNPAQPNYDHFAIIRPSLPTSQDIRSRIPPHGITPAKLSASYGNMLVGRGLFKNGQRREAFWNLVAKNAKNDGTNLLKPLYPGAYTGPPKRPELPPQVDIMARVPRQGIEELVFEASFGRVMVGKSSVGLPRDQQRRESFWRRVDEVAGYDIADDILMLRPPFPTNTQFCLAIPPQGIFVNDLIKRMKGHWSSNDAVISTQDRKLRFSRLLRDHADYDPETGLVMPRRQHPMASAQMSEEYTQ